MPGSLHSVTCSLPTMKDVVGYEEKDPATMKAVTVGYPRFVSHIYIQQVKSDWSERFSLAGRQLFIAASEVVAREALAFSTDGTGAVLQADGFWGVHVADGSAAAGAIKAYLQHTGGSISSRQAEDYLVDKGLVSTPQAEERGDPERAEAEVRREVADLFGAPPDHVFLSNSGMNAFFSVFHALNAEQVKKGRRDWVQLGWLYVDTIEILRKLSGGEHHFLTDVLDLDVLETLLQERGDKVAGIVTEVPTNPLLQTPDLARLREIAARYQIALVVDPTLASPYNIDILSYCDVAVNSLTKYAASQGDVMQGAVVVNPASAWASTLCETVPGRIIPPYAADLSRMAVEIRDYRPVMEKINANTLALTDWLQRHPGVEKVFGAYSAESGKQYTRLQRRPNAPGGVVSITLRRPVADFYDRIQIPKGPSFGTIFTMLCPFLYLAHYNLVSTEEGRAQLRANGLDSELLRISVGLEEADQIIAAFQEAL